MGWFYGNTMLRNVRQQHVASYFANQNCDDVQSFG